MGYEQEAFRKLMSNIWGKRSRMQEEMSKGAKGEPFIVQELTGTGSVHAQFVVHDPGHTLLNSTEWIANVKKWVTQINEMIDAQELRLGLQKIDQLKELKSLKELADLLDDVACLSSDYSFYLNVGSNYHCLKFLNFQRVTVNLSLSTDLLFKVATVTSYFSMNSEGRMSFIEQVKESVRKTGWNRVGGRNGK